MRKPPRNQRFRAQVRFAHRGQRKTPTRTQSLPRSFAFNAIKSVAAETPEDNEPVLVVVRSYKKVEEGQTLGLVGNGLESWNYDFIEGIEYPKSSGQWYVPIIVGYKDQTEIQLVIRSDESGIVCRDPVGNRPIVTPPECESAFCANWGFPTQADTMPEDLEAKHHLRFVAWHRWVELAKSADAAASNIEDVVESASQEAIAIAQNPECDEDSEDDEIPEEEFVFGDDIIAAEAAKDKSDEAKDDTLGGGPGTLDLEASITSEGRTGHISRYEAFVSGKIAKDQPEDKIATVNIRRADKTRIRKRMIKSEFIGRETAIVNAGNTGRNNNKKANRYARKFGAMDGDKTIQIRQDKDVKKEPPILNNIVAFTTNGPDHRESGASKDAEDDDDHASPDAEEYTQKMEGASVKEAKNNDGAENNGEETNNNAEEPSKHSDEAQNNGDEAKIVVDYHTEHISRYDAFIQTKIAKDQAGKNDLKIIRYAEPSPVKNRRKIALNPSDTYKQCAVKSGRNNKKINQYARKFSAEEKGKKNQPEVKIIFKPHNKARRNRKKRKSAGFTRTDQGESETSRSGEEDKLAEINKNDNSALEADDIIKPDAEEFQVSRDQRNTDLLSGSDDDNNDDSGICNAAGGDEFVSSDTELENEFSLDESVCEEFKTLLAWDRSSIDEVPCDLGTKRYEGDYDSCSEDLSYVPLRDDDAGTDTLSVPCIMFTSSSEPDHNRHSDDNLSEPCGFQGLFYAKSKAGSIGSAEDLGFGFHNYDDVRDENISLSSFVPFRPSIQDAFSLDQDNIQVFSNYEHYYRDEQRSVRNYWHGTSPDCEGAYSPDEIFDGRYFWERDVGEQQEYFKTEDEKLRAYGEKLKAEEDRIKIIETRRKRPWNRAKRFLGKKLSKTKDRVQEVVRQGLFRVEYNFRRFYVRHLHWRFCRYGEFHWV